MSEYLTADEVGAQLRITGKIVREWCRSKRLKAIKAGKQWRIALGDLHAFVHQHEEVSDKQKMTA